MKKFFSLCILSSTLGLASQAQSLPMEIRLSADGHMLSTGGQSSTGYYDSSVIRDLKLTFAQTNYWTQLTNNYQSQTEIPASLEVDGTTYPNVGVRFRGNTSYQSVGNSQKKSFKISMDYADEDQKLMGYKSLKLNNQAGDASFIREVFYLHQIRKHIPAAKANYVHLYINGADWGIYPNIQQLNKQFLKEWFLSNDGANFRADAPSSGGSGPGPGGPGGPGGGGQWGDGTAALNYLGADTALYQSKYELKSSDISDPWTKLVAGCNALNNTSTANLPAVLPNYFDVDRVLWFLASEIAFADDDSYIMKGKMDYYVYYEPETGRLTPVEYDGNSILESAALTWSPFKNETNVNYPLLNKILAVPQWRQRYLAHLRTVIEDELDATNAQQVIDNYKTQIDALYNADPKKLFTYAQFTSGVTSLKNAVNTRRANLLANAEMAQVAPIISTASYFNASNEEWEAPMAMEPTSVRATVTSANGIYQVNMYYASGLVGNFTSVQMFDDGAHNDGASGDGVFGATVPGFSAGSRIRFYVEALAGNTAHSASYLPKGAEHDVYTYEVKSSASSVTGVVINELMASNITALTDNMGEYDDWVELYNTNASVVNIGGFYLSDNPFNLPKFKIPAGTTIPANEYLIFWADEDSSQGSNHMNFKLSASAGEKLFLLDAGLNLVDTVTFGIQPQDKGYARIPNGTGSFVSQNHTFNGNNEIPLGVDEYGAEQFFSVYPNPAQNHVQISVSNPDAGKYIEIYNSVGQCLMKVLSGTQVTVDVSTLSQGVYYIKYGATTQRVIVVK